MTFLQFSDGKAAPLIQHRTTRAGFIVAALCAAYAVAFVDRSLMGVAGAPIKIALGLSDTQFGLMHGLAFVALYCLCGIPAGWMADRLDRRMLISAALLFWSVMTAACGLTTSASLFFMARVGVGLGEAILVPAGMSLLSSAVDKARMARSVAIFLMGAALGNAVALLGGGFLLNRLNAYNPFQAIVAPWQVLFLIACVPGLVLGVVFACVREPEREASVRATNESVGGLFYALEHLWAFRKAYGFLTAATGCSVMLAQAQSAWAPLFYARKFGLFPGDSAISVGLMFLLSAPIGQWAGGLSIDRLSARGVSAPSHLVLTVCALAAVPPAYLFCLSDDLWISRAAYVVFNFLVFAATPAGLTGWQFLTPERNAGVTIAILISLVTLMGAGLGPVLVGWANDSIFQDESALGISLFAVISAAAAACVVLSIFGRKSYALAIVVRRQSVGQ